LKKCSSFDSVLSQAKPMALNKKQLSFLADQLFKKLGKSVDISMNIPFCIY